MVDPVNQSTPENFRKVFRRFARLFRLKRRRRVIINSPPSVLMSNNI